ncbi:MAG TPA: PDZ domain-containing protein [Caulifigura sp.]|nr:PDZ domain-containing protein [Caulifigura sp.]
MLVIVSKSAAALLVGGALFAQQDARRDVAPPAPTVDAPQAPPANNRNVIQNDQNLNRSDNLSRPQDAGRQTFQSDQQSQLRQAPQDQPGRAALGVTLTDDLTISHVSPGSPAARMGLRSGDEILALDGQTFDSVDAFIQTVGSTPANQQIRLEIDRNGQNMTQSGQLAGWDQVHYSGTHRAGKGYQQGGMQHSGIQQHEAMRFPNDGVVQGQAFDQFGGTACCDPCAGFSGYGDSGFYGAGSGGYGYPSHNGGWDDGWDRRGARRAARRGYDW